MIRLRRVVPNEKWQLILHFGTDGMRLFDATVAGVDKLARSIWERG
jgi:hypothetical protein